MEYTRETGYDTFTSLRDVCPEERLWCDAPDLTQPDDFSDVVLLVEDQKLFTCRGILASASPVWRRMFVADFREKVAKEIPLPGKRFGEVLELLLCISPAIQKSVTAENVMTILPLADEYQMQKLKHDCEVWLLQQLATLPSLDTQMRYLSLAQRLSLPTLLEKTVELVSELAVEDLEGNPGYEDLERDTVVRILKRRVQCLEKRNDKLKGGCDTWRKKCEDLEDCLKRLSREKLSVKRVLDDVDGAWELKGSDARCIDPVHIYGPRIYSCEKCSRQVHTYIQAKVWHLLNRGSTCSGITWPQ